MCVCVCVCVCVHALRCLHLTGDLQIPPCPRVRVCLCVSRGGCFPGHSRVPVCVCCSVLWAVRVNARVCVSVIPVRPCLGMCALVPPGVRLCEPVCVCDCISECLAVHVCVPKWGFCLWLPVATCPQLYLRECPRVPGGPSAQSWFSRAGPSRWR